VLARQFPWQNYRTFIDIGTAEGGLPVEIAIPHPHLVGGGFDLPELQSEFEAYVNQHGLAGRLQFYPGNFFEEQFPAADVLILGRVLHNWDLATKHMLLRRAYDALPVGGALVVLEILISEDRRSTTAGLLASLNMLLWTQGGFDFTAAECMEWMRETGFRNMRLQALAAEQSMVVGMKS
jgi:hypothetical protein